MTPKRYLVFGALVAGIQGIVLASQSTSEIVLPTVGKTSSINAIQIRVSPLKVSQTSDIKPSKNASEKQAAETSSEHNHQQKQHKHSAPKKKIKPITEPVKFEPITSQSVKTVAKPTIKQATIHDTTEVVKQQRAAQTHGQQGVVQLQQLSQPRFAVPPTPPRYPKLARRRGIEGVVNIEVLFDQQGQAISIELQQSSGFAMLDKAALVAVKQWQFAAPSPATAKRYKVQVPVRFALNQ